MRGGRTSTSQFSKALELATAHKRKLLAKLQNEIFEDRARGPIPEVETFAGAALRYMEAGGEKRFIAPVLRHFGETPIDQIDQQAIDRAAAAIYPRGANATRNRQVYTPVSAVLQFAGVNLDVRRLKAPPGIIRWIEPEEAAAAHCSLFTAPPASRDVLALHGRASR